MTKATLETIGTIIAEFICVLMVIFIIPALIMFIGITYFN